jgi:hypothetical protein
MSRLRLLVACTVVNGSLAAAGLFAAEQNAAKSPTEKPRLRIAVAADANPFAERPSDMKPKEAMPPKMRAKSPRTPPAKHSRRRVAQQPPQQPSAPRAKIEDALASVTHMDFKDVPLGDVIDYLKESHNIEIQLDKRPLEDVNVTAKTRVTVRVKNISLKSALHRMFHDMQPELTYVIKDGILLITTPEVECEEQTTEVYDVADLVVCRDEHDVLWDDYDSLIDIITSTSVSTSWSDDPPGTIVGRTIGTAKVLVVFHNREQQERIADLLGRLHEAARLHRDAGVPRRSRPAHPPERNGRKAESSGMCAGTVVTGPSRPSGATKPAEKPPDAAKPPEQKPPSRAAPQAETRSRAEETTDAFSATNQALASVNNGNYSVDVLRRRPGTPLACQPYPHFTRGGSL